MLRLTKNDLMCSIMGSRIRRRMVTNDMGAAIIQL